MCVRIDSVIKADGRIEWVGGPSGWGDARWMLPVADVVQLIDGEDQQWDFFVEEPAGDRVQVVTRTSGSTRYLTTLPDTDPAAQNNLANLPPPPGGSGPPDPVPPPIPAWLPGPRTPRMERFGRSNTTRRSDGYYGVLPTTGVGFRLVAPWPGDLRFTVRRLMNGQPNLELEVPGGRRDSGPWVDYTPLEPGFETRDATLWWVQVHLPPPAMGVWVRAETYEIDVRHQSFNPFCPEPGLSPLLRIAMDGAPIRVVSAGGGGGGGGASPTAGTSTVRFSSVGDGRPGYPTRFEADTRQLAGVPSGAVITSVVNTSRTAPQNTGPTRDRRPLGDLRITLTDSAGDARVVLGADDATSAFNGRQLRSRWTADYVGGSTAFLFERPGTSTPLLNPEIALRVSWAAR